MFDDSKGVHVIRSRISEKGRQYNDQKEGQTIQWPKRRADNTMTKKKGRQYNDQKEKE
jgi:hypothetical protein